MREFHEKYRLIVAKWTMNLTAKLEDEKKTNNNELGVSEKRENMVSFKCVIQLRESDAAYLLFRNISVGS